MPGQINFMMRIFLCAVMVCLGAIAQTGRAQEVREPAKSPQTTGREDEVIRVNTNLVQTDVMVFDKKGRFVDGLEREQFGLRVDGQPQPISFFERVTAGSATEEAQLAAARGTPRAPATVASTGARGRTIIFFVDDLHLSPDGIQRTREVLLNFINKDMGPGDQALVASSSGGIGFLQQFTDNKDVLRAAVARVRYQTRSVLDNARRPMTAYQARAIDRNDRDVLEYKIAEALSELPIIRNPANFRAMAEQQVRSTARNVLQQASVINSNILSTLESLARGSGSLPGRKLVFFVSDGFVVDPRNSNVRYRLQRVTDAAARTGTVIYTVDARGLFASFADASTEVLPELANEGLSASVSFGSLAIAEAAASQEVLRTLAAETGGRAILNTNNIKSGITKVLEETSAYYLLAWRPERVEQNNPTFRRLEVSIKGRPDLTVMVRRGFYDAPLQPPANSLADNKTVTANSPNAELNAALNSPFTRRDLSVALYATFTNDPASGSMLNASVQLAPEGLEFIKAGDKQNAEIDLAYFVLNSEGKLVSSSGRKLTWMQASANEAESNQNRLLANFPIPLAKGLYQVRVAARDGQSGRIGSAFQWVEIPEFAPKQFSLSSLLIGERRSDGTRPDKDASALQDIKLNVGKRFSRASRMLLQLYIYNPARPSGGGAAPPDVSLEIQILRNDRLVIGAPAHRVATAQTTDFARIPYAAEIPLRGMSAGLYTLQVSATDRIAKASATQRVDFVIE